MADKRLSRPDAGLVKSMTDLSVKIDNTLRQVMDSEQTQRRSAQKAARSLHDARLRQELEEMDVEHINNARQGIRVALLRDAGIENVYQVSMLSYRQLCDLDGIGEQTAAKIQTVVKQIQKNTKENLRVRICVDDPAPEDEDLVKALYTMIHCRPLRTQYSALYKLHHTALQKELPAAREAASGFGWLFKSKKRKEEVIAACESMRQRLESPFGDGILLSAWEEIGNVSPGTYWQDYQENASSYFAELEMLGLNWEKEEETPGGLPAELAAKIDARQLDLQYLKATLRNYQTFGTKYAVEQKRVLLGDEMGLGKTVTAIASMAALKAEGKHHFMVVCPASVLINWCREIQKHSTLEVTKVHGNDEDALLYWRENGDVAVTTYESVSRFQLPEKFKIGMIVADEAHYVKNPEAQRTKALTSLLDRTENVLFMSGTPLENRVEEMCYLVSCLQPKIAQSLESVKFISTAEQFRQQLAPVYLRRTRDDVLQELPDLIEKEQWCDLGEAEKKCYKDAVLSGNFMAIRQVSWQVDDLKDSSKAKRLLELCDQAREQKRKVIVFSFFRATLQKVITLLGDRCLEPISGDISPQRRQEIVDEFTKAEDGTVLASQVQAGGTGLNIQSASVIIFCEPQIKPSIENQAIARAYRMGQVRDVLVYRLLADDTVDEQIMEILKNKQQLFDSFADESVVGEESLKPSEQAWIQNMVEAEKQRLLESEAQVSADPS